MLGRLGQTACALALAAGAVSGCGDDDGETAGLASLTPPDAPVYAEVVIRPDGEQTEAIESFAERVGGIDDPGALIVSQLDSGFAAEGLDVTYGEDVEPWLGDRAAVFVSSFEPTSDADSADFAVMVEVDDADAARAFLRTAAEQDSAPEEDREYEGVDYIGDGSGHAAGVIGDSALVLGTESAFEVAVDSSQGESLAESPEYEDRIGELPEEPLVSSFFEPAATVEALIAAEGVDSLTARMWAPLLDALVSEPVAIALSATPDAASVDVAAMTESGAIPAADPSLISELPADAWLAVAVPDLGAALQHALDQLTTTGLPGARELERRVRGMTGLELRSDVLSWLGDAAGFIAGTTPSSVSLGLIAETSDADAPGKLIAALRALGAIDAAVVDDAFVAVRGTTVEEAVEPTERLGDDPAFQVATEALGDLPAGLYLDLPSFFTVAEQGSEGDLDYDALRPYLNPFASLVAGSRVDGDLVLSRFTVSLGE